MCTYNSKKRKKYTISSVLSLFGHYPSQLAFKFTLSTIRLIFCKFSPPSFHFLFSWHHVYYSLAIMTRPVTKNTPDLCCYSWGGVEVPPSSNKAGKLFGNVEAFLVSKTKSPLKRNKRELITRKQELWEKTKFKAPCKNTVHHTSSSPPNSLTPFPSFTT